MAQIQNLGQLACIEIDSLRLFCMSSRNEIDKLLRESFKSRSRFMIFNPNLAGAHPERG